MAGDLDALDNLSPVKRALFELREMRAKLDEYERAKTEPIAIVGLGLRFPGGANDAETFWQLLHNGVDAISPFPKDRGDIEPYYNADSAMPDRMLTRNGGFIENVEQFDPHFFGIAPREAISMDPQQRLLLETSWEALEGAGQAPDKLNGSQTGVFFGISSSDYFRLAFPDPDNTELYPITGNAFSVAAGRLSYILGLQGPSIALDTACSSSLVAVHLACQSLRAGECNLALAGGVNLILSPEVTLSFANAQMMAADDHCKTFDAAADGYVRGEGCAVVVLKRLSDALANGDNILALIRGSAVNQDGRSSGLTAPNGPSQEAVIRQAVTNAGVEPSQVSYVETHGTGTPLGDPIEVQALAAALGEGRAPEQKLIIGSVKTNIGHLEAAAGIAGLVKVVLALQNQEIPPHLNLRQLNPYIAWDKIPVEVATQRMPWPAGQRPRLAGVSSFGFSGTNAHVILEEAPVRPVASVEVERPFHVLTLSAKREAVLGELAGQFETFLSSAEGNFPAICFTANTGRAHLPHRLAVVAASAEPAREQLAAWRAGQEATGVFQGQAYNLTPAEVAFLFTGHGAQYINMGCQFYTTQPLFRAAIEQCDELLRPYLDRSLLSILYPEPGAADLMDKMTYAQPALFALEYALAMLWRSWGVEPTVVLGHSVGEYVAACVAGVFSLADGLKLVAARGRLMDSLSETGEMVAVFADEARVAAAVAPYTDRAAIAAVNGPQSVVISGTTAAIQAILDELQAEQIKFRRLAIGQAAHSPLLDPILDEFEKIAAEVAFTAPQISLISGVTGKLAVGAEITHANYWRRHLRQPVQFAKGIETLRQEGYGLFVEIGPHPTLLGMGRRCWPEGEEAGMWLPSLRQGWDEWQQMLESLATLYVQGVEVNWAAVDQGYSRRRLRLPTYPWTRERYWLETTTRRPASPTAVLPMWETATSAGQRQARQAPLDLSLSTYPAKWQTLEYLTTTYINHTLRTLGAFLQSGESHSVESLLAQTGILPSYHGLLIRWLKRLAGAGLLQQQGEEFTSPQPLPAVSLEAAWAETQKVLLDLPQLQAYLERCGAKLAAILTGQDSPLETLFPEGSFSTADFLYHDWSLVRYFNGIMQAVVEAAVKTLPLPKQFKVLEIGAGTGGTAAALLPIVPPERTLYYYTDVSEFFFARAEEKFKAYPFVRYGLLNAEQEPQAQGYSAHQFDLVVAANAIHATRDLHETLTHVRTLLAPGGLFLLFEATEHLAWFDITTGLIEGWGRFEDNLRQDNPLLSVEQWQEILQASGFEKIEAWPEVGSPAKALGQHLIIAQAPLAGEGQEDGPAVAFDSVSRPGQTQAGDNSQASQSEEFMAQLIAALPDERKELLVDFVRAHVAKILRLPATPPVGRRERLLDLGLDSLMAVELRNRLRTGLALEESLPATLVFDYPTIEAIAGYLAKEILPSAELVSPVFTEVLVAQEEPIQPAIDVTDLSDEEVEALLLKKLESI